MPVNADGTVEQPPTGGPGPDSPLEVPASGWRDVARRTLRAIVHDRITITAAGVALYWFLSIFPLLFAAIGLLDVMNASPTSARTINDAIARALPGDAALLLTRAVTSAQSRAAAGGLTPCSWGSPSRCGARPRGWQLPRWVSTWPTTCPRTERSSRGG